MQSFATFVLALLIAAPTLAPGWFDITHADRVSEKQVFSIYSSNKQDKDTGGITTWCSGQGIVIAVTVMGPTFQSTDEMVYVLYVDKNTQYVDFLMGNTFGFILGVNARTLVKELSVGKQVFLEVTNPISEEKVNFKFGLKSFNELYNKVIQPHCGE